MKLLWLGAAAILMASASWTPAMAADIPVAANWSALANQVTVANIKADALGARMADVTNCGRQGKIYAPGAKGVTADDCLETSTTAGVDMTTLATTVDTVSTQAGSLNETITRTNKTLTSLINCGHLNQGYNGTACVNLVAVKPSCGLNIVKGAGATCPAGFTLSAPAEGPANPTLTCIRMVCK